MQGHLTQVYAIIFRKQKPDMIENTVYADLIVLNFVSVYKIKFQYN